MKNSNLPHDGLCDHVHNDTGCFHAHRNNSITKIDAEQHENQIPSVFSKMFLLKKSVPFDQETIGPLKSWIEQIRDWSLIHGGVVGHIKVLIEGREMLWLSSTGREVDMKISVVSSPGMQENNLYLTAIVLFVPDQEFCAYCKSTLEHLIRGEFAQWV